MSEIRQVMVHLDESIFQEIRGLCGGTGGGRGRSTGVSRWIREVVHRVLKRPPPEQTRNRERVEVAHVPLETLDRRTRLIVELHLRGLTFGQIVKWLVQNEVPTPRGGAWRRGAIRTVLEKASRRATLQAAGELGIEPAARRAPGRPRSVKTG